MKRIGVIGLGYWGPNVVRALRASPDTRVVACCDLDRGRLATLADAADIRLTTDVDDVLGDPDIDAVAIATPAATHYAVVRAALGAGKHVFVEKPLTTDSRDAAALVECAEAAGRTLMVGHLFAYHPGVQALLGAVQGGLLGPVEYVHSVRTSMGGWARRDTNIAWDALVHDVYILTAVFGSAPESVSAIGGTFLNPGIEDVAQATFTFSGGRVAYCFASWYAVERSRRMMVVGSRRMLMYDDLAPRRQLALHDSGYVPDGAPDVAGRRRMRWEARGVSYLPYEADEPLRVELEHFITCLETKQQARTDGRAGLETVAVLEAVDASLKARGQPMTVTVPRPRS